MHKSGNPDLPRDDIIQALEEEFEDMHMTTAGTEKGLVVVQLDCRIPSIPFKALEVALARARPARLSLLDSLYKGPKKVPELTKYWANIS